MGTKTSLEKANSSDTVSETSLSNDVLDEVAGGGILDDVKLVPPGIVAAIEVTMELDNPDFTQVSSSPAEAAAELLQKKNSLK